MEIHDFGEVRWNDLNSPSSCSWLQSLWQEHRSMNAPQSQTVLRPAEGKPADSTDPYFSEVRRELTDKGFFTASAEELITWARTGSLMWMTFGLACCAIEM